MEERVMEEGTPIFAFLEAEEKWYIVSTLHTCHESQLAIIGHM
jgi:hypothetical protein